MTSKATAFGVLIASALALVGCGSDEAMDPRLEPLSPVAREAFGAVITEAEPMRIVSSQGTKMSMMGQNIDRPADLDNPLSSAEIDGDGEMHMNIDPTAALAVDVGIDGTVELWTDEHQMVWDVSSGYSKLIGQGAQALPDSEVYQALADVYQEAGRFRIDRDKVDATGLGADPVVQQITGTNWDEMFASFAEHFDKATPVDGDDNTRTLQLTYGDLYGSEAAAKLLESMFGGAALPFDESVMSTFVDNVKNAPVEATIGLDEKGRVERTEFNVDLSNAMKTLIADAGAASEEKPSQDEIDAVTDGIELAVDGVVSVTYDESIEVEIPTDVSDDRTEAYIELMEVLTEEPADAADTTVSTAGDSAPVTTIAS